VLPHGLLQVNDRALFGRLPLLGRLFMTLMAICPICSKTIDSVCFEKEHLYKRTIPVWHSADNEDHHWSLDEQSSENVRRYFSNGQSAFSVHRSASRRATRWNSRFRAISSWSSACDRLLTGRVLLPPSSLRGKQQKSAIG